MSVESFEDAIQFYKAAEASLPMMSPVAADVFLKESLCYMYLGRNNEAIKYAINAYHLKQQQGDEEEVVSCLEQCVAIFITCGRIFDVWLRRLCDVVSSLLRERDRELAEEGPRGAGEATGAYRDRDLDRFSHSREPQSAAGA